MKVAELREILQEVESIYEASGSPRPAQDFRRFIELLGGRDEQTIEVFLSELSSLLTAQSGKNETIRRDPDVDVVKSFVERLAGARTDATQFERVFTELRKDKRVRAEEMNAIAHGYIKGREKWPSRAAAYEAIQKKFVERADKEGRTGILEKLKRWG